MRRDGTCVTNATSPAIEIVTIERLTERAEAALLAFFGAISKPDIYWLQICPAFDPGPGLVIAARVRRLRGMRGTTESLHAVMHCRPQEGLGAVMSSIYTLPRLVSDTGLAAAVLKVAVEAVGSFGFNVRYVVREQASLVARALMTARFRQTGTTVGQEGARFRVFEAPADVMLRALRIHSTPIKTLIALGTEKSRKLELASNFLARLQLGAMNQPPDIMPT